MCGVAIGALFYCSVLLLPERPPVVKWCMPGTAICWYTDPQKQNWVRTLSILIIPVGLALIQLATIATAAPLSYTLGGVARVVGTSELFVFGGTFGVLLASAMAARCGSAVKAPLTVSG
jgi:hypothetical protein